MAIERDGLSLRADLHDWRPGSVRRVDHGRPVLHYISPWSRETIHLHGIRRRLNRRHILQTVLRDYVLLARDRRLPFRRKVVRDPQVPVPALRHVHFLPERIMHQPQFSYPKYISICLKSKHNKIENQSIHFTTIYILLNYKY